MLLVVELVVKMEEKREEENWQLDGVVSNSGAKSAGSSSDLIVLTYNMLLYGGRWEDMRRIDDWMISGWVVYLVQRQVEITRHWQRECSTSNSVVIQSIIWSGKLICGGWFRLTLWKWRLSVAHNCFFFCNNFILSINVVL